MSVRTNDPNYCKPLPILIVLSGMALIFKLLSMLRYAVVPGITAGIVFAFLLMFSVYIISFINSALSSKSKSRILSFVVLALLAMQLSGEFVFDLLPNIPYYNITNLLTYFFVLQFYALAMIGVFKKNKGKVFIIIAFIGLFAIRMINTITSFGSYIRMLSPYTETQSVILTYFGSYISNEIAITLLYIVLMILCIKSSISAKPAAAQGQGGSISNELKLLNKKYELGVITYEEYQTQRAQLINRI